MNRIEKKLKQRELRVFNWVAGVMFLCFITAIVYVTRPAQRPPPAPERTRWLGDFRLTDRTGREVTRAELRDKSLVVNFVFTSCSASCARVNLRMAELQQKLTNRDDVQLVSFTVDPGTDTPAVLEKFGARFGAETNRWLLLTGDKRNLYELIEDSFLPRDMSLTNSPMPGGFVGTERIVVVDRSGRVRRYFDGYNADSPAAIVAYLDELHSESETP